MLFAVALIALRIGVSPLTVMRWRETQFMLWVTMLEQAADHIGRSDALRVSLAVWAPDKLAVRTQAAPADPPEFRAEAERGIARAREIEAMIDSGSRDSLARLQRRREQAGADTN